MAIGKRIEERLKTLGWRRADLMDRVEGLTPQALSNLIRRDSARSEWDEAIAEALGVSVMWLVYGRDAWPAAGNVVPLAVREPDVADRVATLVRTMSQEGQWAMLGQATLMAQQFPQAAKKPASS